MARKAAPIVALGAMAGTTKVVLDKEISRLDRKRDILERLRDAYKSEDIFAVDWRALELEHPKYYGVCQAHRFMIEKMATESGATPLFVIHALSASGAPRIETEYQAKKWLGKAAEDCEKRSHIHYSNGDYDRADIAGQTGLVFRRLQEGFEDYPRPTLSLLGAIPRLNSRHIGAVRKEHHYEHRVEELSRPSPKKKELSKFRPIPKDKKFKDKPVKTIPLENIRV